MIPYEEIEHIKKDLLLKELKSIDELQKWIYLFFDIWMPRGFMYHESSSSSLDAIWEIYCAVRDNTGNVTPGYILLASRDSYKTISASILEVLLMVHFRITIAHAAAIVSQSQKSVEYCTSFIKKILPYLKANGWEKVSDNKMKIEFITDKGESCYIQIIVLTQKGANSAHTNILCVHKNTNILVKDTDPNSVRERKKMEAQTVFKKLERGENIEVLSFNHDTGAMQFIKPTFWAKSKKNQIVIEAENKKKLIVSPDHKIFINNKGYVEAKNIQLNDEILFIQKKKSLSFLDNPVFLEKTTNRVHVKGLNEYTDDEIFEQMILGSLLGDGCVYRKKQKANACYIENHSIKQKDYLDWKKLLLEKKLRIIYTKPRSGYKPESPMVGIRSGQTPILNEWSNFKKKPDDRIFNLKPLGLAIWFMDDGSMHSSGISLHTESFDLETLNNLVKMLKINFDLEFNIYDCSIKGRDKKYYRLIANAQNSYKLYEICKNFIHPELSYKFNSIVNKSRKICSNCGDYFILGDTDNYSKYCTKGLCQALKYKYLKKSKITKIYTDDKLVSMYDFTVPGNHNFFANNILVHNCVDEIDLCDPTAYQEAKMIPGVFKGRYPITIRLSTRKFAFGLMEKEIQASKLTQEKVLRWNILDVTEYCPPERCLPDQPTETRYISRNLPLEQMSEERFKQLDQSKQNNYEKIEAYKGCVSCPLLSVCKKRLHDNKDPSMVGDLWKPIDAVINQIKQVEPDVAEAQLLCHKPSSKGLIYPRFSSQDNVLTVQEAWERLSGTTTPCTFEQLVQYIKDLGLDVHAGVDWGYTAEFAIVVVAKLSAGESIVLDTFAAPEQELADCVRIAKQLRDKYGIMKFWCDQAYPAYIKEFNKNGLKSPEFTKDVPLGIESVRGRILDSNNTRRFFILKTDNNERTITGVSKYHWVIDAQGNPTDKPARTDESDILDALRYAYQNMYGRKTSITFSAASGEKSYDSLNNAERMAKKIQDLAINDDKTVKNNKKKQILWI